MAAPRAPARRARAATHRPQAVHGPRAVTRTALSRPLLTAAPRQEEQRRRRRMAEARPLLFRERRSGLLASCSRHAKRPEIAVGTRTIARRQPQSTAGESKVSAARCAGAGPRWRVGSAQPERRSGHDAVRLPRHGVDLVRVPRVVVSDRPELRSVELGHPVTLGPRFVPALVERSQDAPGFAMCDWFRLSRQPVDCAASGGRTGAPGWRWRMLRGRPARVRSEPPVTRGLPASTRPHRGPRPR